MNNQALGTGLRVPSPGPPRAPELVSEAGDIPSRPGQEAGLPLREGSRLHSPVLAERDRRLRPGPSRTEKERIPMWLRPRLFARPGPGAGGRSRSGEREGPRLSSYLETGFLLEGWSPRGEGPTPPSFRKASLSL